MKVPEVPPRIPAVGVVCCRPAPDGAGFEVLLIRRGKPPGEGRWSIPGGRLEPGETARMAALRELGEETAVEARLLERIAVIEADFEATERSAASAYLLIDYAALWRSGEPVAGDDAAEAVFVHEDDLEPLGLWSETARVIALGLDAARRETGGGIVAFLDAG